PLYFLKRNEIVLVALMALLNFTHILDFMIMMPLGNILMPQWNLNSSQFSIIVSSYSLAAFVSSFAAIFFADKFDRKNVLLVAYFGFLAGTVGCAFATNAATMIIARSVTGIFGGLISAQVLSIIADIIPYERRGQAMGMLMGGFALASVVGVPFGLYLANQFNWYFPFLVVAGVGVLLLPLLLRYVPSVRGHLANPIPLKGRIESFVHIFSDRTQMTALVFSFILIMGHFLIIPLFNPYMVYNVGVPQKDTPLIYLFGGISSLITAQFVGKLSDKYGKRQVFVIAAAASLILILMLTNMPKIPVYWVLIIFSVWFSAATGRTVPGQAMTTQAVSAKTRGSFMSLNSCMQSLGTGFAGLLSGWLTFSDANFAIHHYDYLGYLSAILILICIALAIRLDKLLVLNGLK
ncbi:MAG: MFS transporter, partial [Flammeovirgaceae bacterium]|nr:MFS transporter [Flammeovirgaceae bacterium]